MAETTIQPPAERVERAAPPSPVPPRRQRPSFWPRVGRMARSWLLETFEPESLISSAKSLVWVAPMTVIIWIYAERENISHQPAQFHAEARNGDPNRVVQLSAPGPDGRPTVNFIVRAELAGTNVHVESVKQKLEGAGLQVDIPGDLTPGHHEVRLASLLEKDPSFEGVTPSNILPPQIDVFIDPIEHKTVPVRVRAAVTNLDGPPAFKPPTVEISGPRSVLESAAADDRLIAYAELPPLTEFGPKSFPNVPVTAPINDPHIRLSTQTVSVDLTVKNPDVDGVLHGVSVFAIYPNGDQWDKFKVVHDSTLPRLNVSGLADTIAQVEQPEYANKPRAFLDLTRAVPALGSAPTPGKTYKAPIIYELGSTGLKVAPDAPASLDFTVVERKAGQD